MAHLVLTRAAMTHAVSYALVLALVVPVSVTACSDDLTSDQVTTIPDGDGTGNAASGRFEIDLFTTSCSGNCAVTVNGFPTSVCDIGRRDSETLTFVQTGGHLQADSPTQGGLFISRMSGGIDHAGNFEVGGQATENGTLDILALSTGQILTDGTVKGTSRSLSSGSVGGQSVSCTGNYEVTGHRED